MGGRGGGGPSRHNPVQVFDRSMNGISGSERACELCEDSLVLYCVPNIWFSAWHIVGA